MSKIIKKNTPPTPKKKKKTREVVEKRDMAMTLGEPNFNNRKAINFFNMSFTDCRYI